MKAAAMQMLRGKCEHPISMPVLKQVYVAANSIFLFIHFPIAASHMFFGTWQVCVWFFFFFQGTKKSQITLKKCNYRLL